MTTAALGVRLVVKVAAAARRERIEGWLGEALKVSVRAPRERGKANRAVAALLRSALGTEPTLLRGERAPRKVFRIDGLDEAEVRARIDRAIEP